MEFSDKHLVDGLRQSDRQAFLCAYERYSARLFGFLLRLAASRELAEDLFQDTWCRLASSANGLRPDTDLWAWLLTVARNVFYDRARRNARRSQIFCDTGQAELPSDQGAAPDTTSAAREQLLLLEQALASLSDIDREILLLVGVEELPYERASRVLGIGDAAFRKRLSRARQRLESALADLLIDRESKQGASRA